MATKTLTIDYDEYEDMKLRLKMLEESKLCTLSIHFGIRGSYSYFATSSPEEFKTLIEETVNKCKRGIEIPLEDKISRLEKQLKDYEEFKKHITIITDDSKRVLWYQFWK